MARVTLLLRSPVLLLLLANWSLSLAGLARQSLWIDEWFTRQASLPAWRDLASHVIAAERRPPLYYAALKAWSAVAGYDELTLRVFSVATTLVLVALTFALAHTLAGRHAAMLAAGLMAFSPLMLLYGRMIRSYALFALLAAAATYALRRLAARPSPTRRLTYAALMVGLLYTDYGGWAVLGVHALWLLRYRPKQLTALIVAPAAFAPWAIVLLRHARSNLIEADLAGSLPGLLLRLAYPFASLGAGETIYPWHPLAALSIAVCGLAALRGLAHLARQCARAAWLLASWFGISLVFTAILLGGLAADITFVNMVSRAPHLVVVYTVLVAVGIDGLAGLGRRVVILGLVITTFAAATFNYYTGRQFHNPIYAVPIRQVVEQVREASRASDLIIADHDTLFGFYYLANPGEAAYQDTDLILNRTTIQATHPARIWLITFGRDRTASQSDAGKLIAWLNAYFSESSRSGYGEAEASYRWLKEQLLHRPAYAYKLTVSVFSK